MCPGVCFLSCFLCAHCITPEHHAICKMHHSNSNGPVKDGLYVCLLHSSACEEQAAWQYGTAITHSLGHDRDKTLNTFQLNHPRSPHALQNIKYHFIFFTRNISVPVLPFSCCFFLVQIHYLQKTCLSLITSYSFNHLTSTSGMFYHNWLTNTQVYKILSEYTVI